MPYKDIRKYIEMFAFVENVCLNEYFRNMNEMMNLDDS